MLLLFDVNISIRPFPKTDGITSRTDFGGEGDRIEAAFNLFIHIYFPACP